MKKMRKGFRKLSKTDDVNLISLLVKRKHRGTWKGKKFLSLEEKEDYHKIVKILQTEKVKA